MTRERKSKPLDLQRKRAAGERGARISTGGALEIVRLTVEPKLRLFRKRARRVLLRTRRIHPRTTGSRRQSIF